MRAVTVAFALGLLLLTAPASADLHSHKYKDGDPVHLWVNKIGPFQNPQESYKYYDFPFCKPAAAEKSSYYEGLGERLQGYDLEIAEVKIHFKNNTAKRAICAPTLTHKDIKAFKYAIRNNYWYQMFFDDLPLWGMVGEVVQTDDGEQIYLYTHKAFSISYNGNRVIEVNMSSEQAVELIEGLTPTFTYSVTWMPTDTSFDKRFDLLLDHTFFEHQIHWFSLFNSFMMVIFLVGVVTMILMRTLRQDFARYAADDESDALGDDSGWKQIHWDVFRAPSNLLLFASMQGIGMQLVLLVLSVIVLAFIGDYYEERGNMATAFVVCYVLTSVVGGYVSGGLYSRFSGKEWIRCMLATATLFPLFCGLLTIILNVVAFSYDSLAFVPFGTMLAVFAIWIFVSLPLTLMGTLLGRAWAGQPNFPCRVAQVPRQIPEKKWYLERWVHICVGGLLPFGSIFIEMYFVMTSFWHYKFYYVYGFSLLVFIILVIVTTCVAIVSTYFLLNAEDHRWQWTSFMSSFSTAAYVFLYGVYYFLVKTKMTGFFQATFYFSYMTILCVSLGLLCGSVGYLGTSLFVRRIYSVKME